MSDRAELARAITLVESSRPTDRQAAEALLERALPDSGGAVRVGVTGVPGVGKSTLIDALGMRLVERGRRVAVLAVDPSSALRGGSILGDKTRMQRLAADERAFVRPTPSGGELGGVASGTRAAILLCEAAGYDVVLVETVGVGQSEARVAEMVDHVVTLLLPGAGDELQGIKRGLLELTDVAAVNKADGTEVERAEVAAQDYRNALQLFASRYPGWRTPVLTCSALDESGLAELWEAVLGHRERALGEQGLAELRAQQRLGWLRATIESRLRERFEHAPQVAARRESIEARVARGELSVPAAAREMLGAFEA